MFVCYRHCKAHPPTEVLHCYHKPLSSLSLCVCVCGGGGGAVCWCVVSCVCDSPSCLFAQSPHASWPRGAAPRHTLPPRPAARPGGSRYCSQTSPGGSRTLGSAPGCVCVCVCA